MFAQGVYYTFGKKIFFLSLIKRAPLLILAAALVVGISSFAGSLAGQVIFYGTILFLFLALAISLRALYDYKSNYFMLDEFSIHMRKGIWNREETAIPYRQILDVTIKESYIERSFGVAELSVFTAGHDEGTEKNADSAIFPLIDHSYALALQQELLKRSNVQEVVRRGEGGQAASQTPIA